MSVHFLVGDDDSTLRSAATALVHRLVGDGDRSLMVDEFDGEEYTVGAVVDAAQTPPFLTDYRVVIARGLGGFLADELAPLIAYLAEPLEETHLVIAWGAQRRPKALTQALAEAKVTETVTSPPSRDRERRDWVAKEAGKLGVQLTAPALDRLAMHLGENPGVLDGILRTLASTYGAAATITPAELEPFLGDAGGVPPWDLTDAIDGGQTTRALEVLGRMVGAGGRHPLQVMAILHGHFARLAALDGSGARNDSDAAAVLGIKGFPAKKALGAYRGYGQAAVRRALDLLAAADLDLRGRTDLDDGIVMELLVARLSRLKR